MTSGATLPALEQPPNARSRPVYDLPIPSEPDDRVVVTDGAGHVWQRLDECASSESDRRWYCVISKLPGFVMTVKGPRTWRHLLVDHGPLKRLVPEDEVDGWQRAGYVDPLAEDFPRAVGGSGAPTPDQAPTRAEPDPEGGIDGPSAADRAYAATNELGGPLLGEPPVATPSSRRPVRDSPQA